MSLSLIKINQHRFAGNLLASKSASGRKVLRPIINNLAYQIISSGPPTPPLSDAVLWQRAQLNSIGAVASLVDSSGSGNAYTQGTGGNQPVNTSGQINGKAAIVFNGSSDSLVGPSGALVSSGMTLVLVVNNTQPNVTYGFIHQIKTSGASEIFLAIANNAIGFPANSLLFAQRGQPQGNITIPTGWSIISFTFDFTTWKAWVNGVAQSFSLSGLAGGSLNGNLMGVNSDGGGGNGYLSASLADTVLSASVESDAVRQSAQLQEGAYYNIPLGQPQISTVDFNGTSGANYVTGSSGKYFTAFFDPSNQEFYVWVNTGTETDPTPSGIVTGIQVNVSPVSSTADISAAVVLAIQLSALSSSFAMSQINGGSTLTATKFATTADNGEYYSTGAIADATTGLGSGAFNTPQTGSGNQ